MSFPAAEDILFTVQAQSTLVMSTALSGYTVTAEGGVGIHKVCPERQQSTGLQKQRT